MKKFRLLTVLILTLGVLLLNVQPALAAPLPPSSFHGTVKINGANVPPGTTVYARINGVQYASSPYMTYLGDTVYALDVPSEDTDTPGIQGGVEWDTVVFFIGAIQATQTGTWHSGTSVELNLTAHINSAPVITEGASIPVTMSEDSSPTAFSLTLHATDADAGDTLTWSISTAATHGTATASGTGTSKAIGYTPTANYNSTDSFVVQVSDGNGGTDTITVNVTITAVNDAPVITEGASVPVIMSEDGSPTAFVLTLHATDADAGDTLTWSVSTAATHGTATASGTGASKAIGYTPTANYSGTDNFVVQVSDGNGGTDTITVNVTINAVNDAPVITEGASVTVTMSEDGSPTAFVLTLNATDVDSGTLTWSISTAATHGTATASGTGISKVIGYTPDVDYTGGDSFVVQVSDGNGGTDTITVNVTINAVNDAPVITEGTSVLVSMSVNGTPTPFLLTLHATDADAGDTLTWSISTAATHGTATASGTGTSKVIGYTPNVDYTGGDSFVVQVSDGNGGTDTITVNVTISGQNNPPVITEGASVPVTMSEDGSPTAFILTLNATDADAGDTLTWSISTAATHGTATASGTGTSKVIGYTPNANYNGSDSFVVQVLDGNGGTDTITVNVTITAVNDVPVITEGATVLVSMSVNGTPTPFSLTLNATDMDAGDTLTWSILTAATHGTATASGTGTSKPIGYTPNVDYTGSDSFVVQVSDGNGGTDTITVNVTITAIPPPGAFNKTSPANGATGQALSLILSWSTSIGATSYEYCYDTSNDNACSSWTSTGTATSANISGLSAITTYYWQVRANNAYGTTYANGSITAYWSFTTSGTTFSDVSILYWAYSEIERLYAAGFTTGCSTNPLAYCPERSVTRAEMAVFIERGIHGAAYIPPAGTGAVFADVPLSYWDVDWIEKLYADQITGGCGVLPLTYCPDSPTTRAEMAVFLLKAKHGAAYTPPAAVGIFADVPTIYWDASWIEQLYAEGITGGCSLSPLSYCPESQITRAEMAVFLVRTFNLP